MVQKDGGEKTHPLTLKWIVHVRKSLIQRNSDALWCAG